MTEHPEELVDDLIDETRGPEEDAPAEVTTDDAAEVVPPVSGADEPVTPEPPD